MYMTEPEADGKGCGELEENEWMGCTEVGVKVGSQNGDNVDLGVVADVDCDSIEGQVQVVPLGADVDSGSVDKYLQRVQVVPLTHHLLTDSLNLIQEIYCFLPVFVVPHHLLIHLLHVHMRLCLSVFLYGEEKQWGLVLKCIVQQFLFAQHDNQYMATCNAQLITYSINTKLMCAVQSGKLGFGTDLGMSTTWCIYSIR